MRIVMTMLVAFLFCACDESVGYFPDYDGGTDSDSDSGSDTDSDTDSDSDTDACDDVTCQDPPDDECQTDGTMHDYAVEDNNGICIDGECIYEYAIETCEWGTCAYDDEGLAYCTSPCDDFDCPIPEWECMDENTIHVYWGGCVVDDETGEPSCNEVLDGIDECSLYGEGYICIVVPDGNDYCGEP